MLSVVSHTSRRLGTMATRDAAAVWRRAAAVAFDVDSTVITTEGIDQLAEFAGADVSPITLAAMEGHLKFEDALDERLKIIKPTAQMFDDFEKAHTLEFSPGVESVIAALQSRGVHVWLVSGGLRPMLEPLARRLSIPDDHIIGNIIHYDAAGQYASFDATVPTSHDGGKAKAMQQLIDAHGYSPLVMIGDGATDLQACPPADMVIGYGGNVERAKVKAECDWWVTDFADLLEALTAAADDDDDATAAGK